MKRHAEAEAERAPREGLHLEPRGDPLLLRFVDTFASRAGEEQPLAIHGEEDPPPAGCAERLLQQAIEETRWGGGDRSRDEVQAGEERAQKLRELQRLALDGLGRAQTTAGLLRRTVWGEEGHEESTQFLKLHRAVLAPPAPEEAGVLVTARAAALESWPNHLRDAGAAVAASRGHTELEGALRYLRQHWLVHCVGGYGIELWNDDDMAKAADPARGLTGKHMVFVGHHPQLGVCVTFPQEFARLVEWRHRLWIEIVPLAGAATGAVSADSLPPAPRMGMPNADMPRGEAIHLVLLDAQKAVVDRGIFRRFCKDFARASSAGAASAGSLVKIR
eukprot:gnl/TRDRNA2_/TRDRNA2_74572_c1_seq1.p1 gnl/TRDRNA2_/TRDRNA2_74572_c1~~gnl/TRDRNA2_/TRDRNA2_74572_c1_seq1.p1  ORF type:complete len:333 (-),score=56.55 gnl/TRDRNA2_/TRDRNA2_74572_c1_seq1:10-1008(-)